MAGKRSRRRGFTLLEVMIASGILLMSLVVLIQMQASSVRMTEDADRILTATQLAEDKLAYARMKVEHEGFQVGDVYEEGDFSDFGSELLNLEMEGLEDYHWEMLIQEVDLEISSNLMSMASQFGATDASGGAASMGDLSMLQGFLSPDIVMNALDPYLREVRVRVWWGKDSDEAEEKGNEVVITQHVINPNGQMFAAGGAGAGAGGQGAAGANPNAQGRRGAGAFQGPGMGGQGTSIQGNRGPTAPGGGRGGGAGGGGRGGGAGGGRGGGAGGARPMAPQGGRR